MWRKMIHIAALAVGWMFLAVASVFSCAACGFTWAGKAAMECAWPGENLDPQ